MTANPSHESTHQGTHASGSQQVPAIQNLLDRPKQWAVSQADHLGGAVRQAAKKLHSDQDHVLATYVEVVADELDRARQYLVQRDPQELLHEARAAVKRRPELLVAGLIVGSVGLALFFKSRQQTHEIWTVPNSPPPPDASYDEAPTVSELDTTPPPGGISGAYEPQPGSPYTGAGNPGLTPENRT